MNYYEPARFPLRFFKGSNGKIKMKKINKQGSGDWREDEDWRRYFETHTLDGKEIKS